MSSSHPKRSFVSGRRNDDFCGRFFYSYWYLWGRLWEVLSWDRDLYVHAAVNNNIHVTMCRRFDLGPGSRHQRESAGSGLVDICRTRRGWVRWDEEPALVWLRWRWSEGNAWWGWRVERRWGAGGCWEETGGARSWGATWGSLQSTRKNL